MQYTRLNYVNEILHKLGLKSLDVEPALAVTTSKVDDSVLTVIDIVDVNITVKRINSGIELRDVKFEIYQNNEPMFEGNFVLPPKTEEYEQFLKPLELAIAKLN